MELKFKCPKCTGIILESCEDNAFVSSQIIVIDEDGDFEYGEPCIHDAIVTRFQCEYCGYVIKNEKEENIDDNLDLIEWLKKNCPQKGEK